MDDLHESGLTFMLVDAFASSAYTGNVAGVVLEADALSDRQMQAIAAEFNASETTFVLRATTRDAAVRFRWFTPGCEVGFCGHATLGAVHALLESGRFTNLLEAPGTILPIESAAGILQVRTEGQGNLDRPYTIWLDMPHVEPKAPFVNIPPILRRLGLSTDDLDPKLPPIRTHDDDVILAVQRLDSLFALRPAMHELADACVKDRLRGVLVTTTQTLSAATVTQSRFFAPAAGVDEDPVTGSVHGPLGLHLVTHGIVPLQPVTLPPPFEGAASGGAFSRADFWCGQSKAGGRAGLVRIVVTDSGDGGKRVRVGGHCMTAASGTLRRLPKE